MKKITILGFTLTLSLLLTACSTTKLEVRINELDEKITRMEEQHRNQIMDLQTEISSLAEDNILGIQMGIGESLDFSETLIIGQDIAPGVYDISIPEYVDSASFDLFEDETARENNDYEFIHLVRGSKVDTVSEELKNYTLKRGNILEISDLINLTKVE